MALIKGPVAVLDLTDTLQYLDQVAREISGLSDLVATAVMAVCQIHISLTFRKI